MKIKIRSMKREDVNEERGDVYDEIYGFESMKSLQRGVISELEDMGMIEELLSDDVDHSGTTVTSDDEIYKKYYKIKELDRLIQQRIEKIDRLDKIVSSKTCKQPTNDQVLAYCNKINLVAKAKAHEKKK